jgi:hypothetical protein
MGRMAVVNSVVVAAKVAAVAVNVRVVAEGSNVVARVVANSAKVVVVVTIAHKVGVVDSNAVKAAVNSAAKVAPRVGQVVPLNSNVHRKVAGA